MNQQQLPADAAVAAIILDDQGRVFCHDVVVNGVEMKNQIPTYTTPFPMDGGKKTVTPLERLKGFSPTREKETSRSFVADEPTFNIILDGVKYYVYVTPRRVIELPRSDKMRFLHWGQFLLPTEGRCIRSAEIVNRFFVSVREDELLTAQRQET